MRKLKPHIYRHRGRWRCEWPGRMQLFGVGPTPMLAYWDLQKWRGMFVGSKLHKENI